MKRNLLLFSMLMAYTCTFAQIEKGKLFAAGYSTLLLDIGNEKSSFNGSTNDEYSFTELSLNPMIGYFVMDKLPVGIYMEVYNFKEKDAGDGDITRSGNLIIGPFARYYIKPFDKLIPYAEARFGLGYHKERFTDEETNKDNGFSYKFGAGASYFFIENVALDAFIGYDYDGYTDKSDSPKTTYFYTSVEINLGIVITFGK